MTNDEKQEQFETWLRTVCFQAPTPEAYDLAKCAWHAALRTKPAPIEMTNDEKPELLVKAEHNDTKP